jgi:hypothetical protein
MMILTVWEYRQGVRSTGVRRWDEKNLYRWGGCQRDGKACIRETVHRFEIDGGVDGISVEDMNSPAGAAPHALGPEPKDKVR